MINRQWIVWNTILTWVGSILILVGLYFKWIPLTAVALALLGFDIYIRVTKLRCPHCKSMGVYHEIKRSSRHSDTVICPDCQMPIQIVRGNSGE